VNGLILSLLVGGGLGALLGRFGQCSSGACPLTANWKRGLIYGAVLGSVFYFASGGTMGSYPTPKNIKTITEGEFEAEVVQSGRPVVVDFYAPWCGPCRTLSPRLDQLAGEFGDRIKFVSVNVDHAQSLAAEFNVQSIPTLLFFDRDGKVAGTSVGLLSKASLLAKLEALSKGLSK
jgi:thioredoxin 1